MWKTVSAAGHSGRAASGPPAAAVAVNSAFLEGGADVVGFEGHPAEGLA